MADRQWYSIHIGDAKFDKTLEQLCKAVTSDEKAEFKLEQERNRMFVFTDIPWDTLREKMTMATVGIAHDRMREWKKQQERKNEQL